MPFGKSAKQKGSSLQKARLGAFKGELAVSCKHLSWSFFEEKLKTTIRVMSR